VSGLEMADLQMPLLAARPMPTRASIGRMPPENRARHPIVEEQVLRHDTEIEP
jgi:hypothetical protein